MAATGKGTKSPSSPTAAGRAGGPGPRRGRSRDERRATLDRMRREQRRRERRTTVIWVSVAVVVAAGLIAAAVIPNVISSRNANKPIAGLLTHKGLVGSQHTTESVSYEDNPPMGGKHDATWLNCGAYDKPVRNENAVHDLEHGAVWITYRPDLPADQVTALRNRVKSTPFLTVSPYPGLPAPVVASSWGFQVRLDSASDPRLARFLTKYRLGRTAPEIGASCRGGTGTPVVTAGNQL